MQNVIVFGANGNVGRAVLAELVSRQHKVTAVVRNESRAATLNTPAKIIVANPWIRTVLKAYAQDRMWSYPRWERA